MTRYMVVVANENESKAYFFDTYLRAQWCCDHVEGSVVELYEYESGEGYLRIS